MIYFIWACLMGNNQFIIGEDIRVESQIPPSAQLNFKGTEYRLLLVGFLFLLGSLILYIMIRPPKGYKDIGVKTKGYGAALAFIFIGIYLIGS